MLFDFIKIRYVMSSESISPVTVPKQPFKRVEIALNKFNDVAIPHHVDLLKRHKNNIQKFQQAEDWDKMYREQINATRLVKQLKALLYEVDMLRSQVQDSYLQKFDRLTNDSRLTAQNAIKEYLVLNPQDQKPVWISARDDTSLVGNTENISEEGEEKTKGLQLHIRTSISSEELAKQEECLKSWENLQAEVLGIHQLFEEFSHVVQEQKEKVDTVENNVEVTAENVHEGTRHLVMAAKYKAAMYPVAGAVLGGCLGGPVGLIAGMKLGGLAAIGCGVIGFTGGQFLKKKQQNEENKHDVELIEVQRTSNRKGSVSYISDHITNS